MTNHTTSCKSSPVFSEKGRGIGFLVNSVLIQVTGVAHGDFTGSSGAEYLLFLIMRHGSQEDHYMILLSGKGNQLAPYNY